jgi:hypothetical protein
MQVRAEIQDVDVNNQLLSDQEITYFGTVESNFWGAAARSAEVVARGFLRKADIKLGRAMQITYSKMAEQYFAMAKVLRMKALGARVPWVGGMSVSDKLAYLQDQDIVASLFTKTMQENPWTGGYTPDSLAPVRNSGSAWSGIDEEQIP